MDMHGVMRSADEHTYVHMPTIFNTTCEKKTSCADAMFKEILVNSDCNFSKLSLKVSKGKQPRKVNPGPPGENSKD